MSVPENVSETQYWLVVGSKENFETTKQNGFTIQGVKKRYRKKAEQMKPGDKIIYYLTGLMVIAGVVTVQSECFEDETFIWPCTNPNETYPWRVKIEADFVPEEAGYLSVKEIKDKLTYLEKWPEKSWTLGFQGNVHQWPQADYLMVRKALEAKKLPTA